jgi:hypothetical protein
VWITEYGNETRPGEPKGVTEAQQASYLPAAVAIARRDPRVEMFIWFVLRDSNGSTWQSGLYRFDGSPKPAAARWADAAGRLDMRNETVGIPAGPLRPVVPAYVRDFSHNNPIGAAVGSTTRVYSGGKLLRVAQARLSLARDCTVPVQVPVSVAKHKTYVVTVDLNATAGNTARRVITIIGT